MEWSVDELGSAGHFRELKIHAEFKTNLANEMDKNRVLKREGA